MLKCLIHPHPNAHPFSLPTITSIYIRYYSPVAGVLEAVLPASEYGLAAFVFRKDLREMLSTVVQLLASVERESEVKLTAKQSGIALYYMAAYVLLLSCNADMG